MLLADVVFAIFTEKRNFYTAQPKNPKIFCLRCYLKLSTRFSDANLGQHISGCSYFFKKKYEMPSNRNQMISKNIFLAASANTKPWHIHRVNQIEFRCKLIGRLGLRAAKTRDWGYPIPSNCRRPSSPIPCVRW